MYYIEIFYASYLIAWDDWLYMLICIFLNKCDLLPCLQSMSYLCTNMHFWNRKCTLEVLDEWPLIDSYDMMILFVDMLISEKYAMLNCFIVNGNLCAKANFETSINKDLYIHCLSLFICRTRLLSYGHLTRKNQIRCKVAHVLFCL